MRLQWRVRPCLAATLAAICGAVVLAAAPRGSGGSGWSTGSLTQPLTQTTQTQGAAAPVNQVSQPSPPIALSGAQSLEGVLTVVWGDPRPGHAGGTVQYSLATPDGQTIPLDVQGQDALATSLFGKHVAISGRMTAASSPLSATPAGSAAQTLSVDTITSLEAPQSEAATSATSAIGTNRVLYLLVKFSDDGAVPHPPSFYTDLNNPLTPQSGDPFPTTVNGFFNKTSWGQLQWSGDVGGVGGVGAPGGWLTLPHPKNYYAPCGWSSSCTGTGGLLTTLGDDATALARAQGITTTNYDNINFVLSNDLDCCAWGGSYRSSVDNKLYGATWEPPWGQNTSTYGHEMGHSIGLPHSGWVYYAYDSPWDIMSANEAINETVCASYYSDNDGHTDNAYCGEPADGYIAAHKDYLGWIPAANEVTVNPGQSATVTLESDAAALGSNAKLIKICLTGYSCSSSSSTARYYTVEARVKGSTSTTQYDNGIPGSGVIIHSVQKDRSAISGSCFFNNQSGWAVPVDATPGDYDSSNCSFDGFTYPYALFNAQFLVGQTYTDTADNFQVSVLSQSGNTYTVSVTPVTQVVTTDSVSPSSGSGVTQTFTLHYSDNFGAADLASAWVWFNASFSSTLNSCFAYYDQTAGVINLLNDSGTTWISGTPGSGGTLQNSQCGVALGSSSVTPSGSGLTLKLAVSFTQGFLGAKNIYGYATGSSANSGWQTLGTWTVPFQCTYGITPTAKTVASTTTSASVAVTAGSGCGWTASTSSGWMTLASGASGSGSGTVSFTFAANTTGAARTATATIAGQTFQLTQLQAGAAISSLVWRRPSDGALTYWALDGSTVLSAGNLTPSAVPDTTWQIVGSGDFNGDGQPDLLWRDSVSGTFGVWYMNGATQIGTAMLNPTGLANNDWKVVGVADFNGDGHPDLLWRDDQTGELCVWYMNGVNLSSIALLSPSIVSDLTWRIAGVGDFNGDGHPDILWRSTVTGQFGVWLMNGVNQISATMLNPPTIGDLNWQIVGVADLDGDGNVDVVWENVVTNAIGAWLMNGVNLKTPVAIGSGFGAAGWWVAAAQ